MPPLQLHFDINKTLLISDPAGGVPTERMVNSLLSECVWGKVDEAAVAQAGCPRLDHFQFLWPLPSVDPPDDSPEWCTFNEYFEARVQPDRATKKSVKGSFTDPGQPGHRFRAHYEVLMSALEIPAGEALEAAREILPCFGEGRYHMLPSFFRLMDHLRGARRDFCVVFRTFGDDVPRVAEEWNAYVDGKHPLFPSPAMPARRLCLPAGSAQMHRCGPGAGGAHMAVVDPSARLVRVCDGLKEIRLALEEGLAGGRTLAVRDHYDFWRRNGESDDSGKLLLVGGRDGSRTLFFDDNIERDRAHIVDARDAATGDPLPFSQTQGRYLIKVEPWEAITDQDYFIKLLARCEASLDEPTRRVGQ